MSLSDIEKILYDRMGLNTASIGSSAVMHSIDERMSCCNISDIEKYKQKLLTDKHELQELVEEVVIPETWFFRDRQPFEVLVRFVKEEWLPSEPDRPLRILSLPCATGEEPYSIAIMLIEAGLMPSQLKIDAFDISERNIKRCRTARYTDNSFRGVDPLIRDRYFTRREDWYYPDILIKAMVNFDTASVLDPSFIHSRTSYDIVFCRNLLIYFDRRTQAQAEKMLGKLLNETGMLFVGHAETGIFIKDWYISQRYPKSFVVRKIVDDPALKNKLKRKSSNFDAKQTTSNKKYPVKNKKPLSHHVLKASSRPVSRPFKQTIPDKEAALVNELAPELALDAAKQLADSGKLVEAEAICIQRLETNKQDTETYCLLALIQLGTGDVQKAVQYFKNVVYLDPDHYDALMYLSTLIGEQGDEAGSSRYRERAQRIKRRLDLKRVGV